MKIFITPDNIVDILHKNDNSVEIEITNQQFEQIRFLPLNHSWLYNPTADTFELIENKSDDYYRQLRSEVFYRYIDNKSKFWWDELTDSQFLELKQWYNAWLNITITHTEPPLPEWLK